MRTAHFRFQTSLVEASKARRGSSLGLFARAETVLRDGSFFGKFTSAIFCTGSAGTETRRPRLVSADCAIVTVTNAREKCFGRELAKICTRLHVLDGAVTLYPCHSQPGHYKTAVRALL